MCPLSLSPSLSHELTGSISMLVSSWNVAGVGAGPCSVSIAASIAAVVLLTTLNLLVTASGFDGTCALPVQVVSAKEESGA